MVGPGEGGPVAARSVHAGARPPDGCASAHGHPESRASFQGCAEAVGVLAETLLGLCSQGPEEQLLYQVSYCSAEEVLQAQYCINVDFRYC